MFRILLVAAGFGIAGTALWTASGSNPISARVLGISMVSSAHVAAAATINLSSHVRGFLPRATVVVTGGSVTFANGSGRPVEVRSAAMSPTGFDLRLAAGRSARMQLNLAGLYHYYDALTGRPLRWVAGNEIITARGGGQTPSEGWIAVLPAAPGLNARLTVPRNQDLFAPKAMVTVIGASVVVSNHDSDAHNFVVDPASPSGAAFLIDGTAQEPPSGWQRVLTMQQAGLYHVYCTMHTRVSGSAGGWRVVQPRPKASGYHDRNPMEAWIIVLPASAS